MVIQHDPEEREIAALRSCVPTFAGYRVLEIGCGDGRLTRRYAAEAESVLAIDPDTVAIEAFRTHAPAHVDLRPIGFEQLVHPAQSFDLILLSWSL